MKTFNVYPLTPITPVKAQGSWLWDDQNQKYLDLYGGHAVISIGHSHPYYVQKITEQLNNIGFYSNSVLNPLQEELAFKLGELSGYSDYNLFLCNSGAEANENALKLASFKNGRKKVIAFSKSFHGRTSAAVAATNDNSIQAEINKSHEVIFLALNDEKAFENTIDDSVCAVIVEGIQGVAGIHAPANSFFQLLRKKCDETGSVLILDEVQSGYGRSGKFFAHQYSNIKPDLITIAKGMGNGFPIAGVLINPDFKAKYGSLGTTFGGNHLACAAAIAVLDVIKEENLIESAFALGEKWMKQLKTIEGIKEVRGKGLMIGIEFDFPIAELKNSLTNEHHILVGTASNKNVIRLLPALNVKTEETNLFNIALTKSLTKQLQNT
ncbi:MAG TPA: aminotransferase class III-fold pyridoxal phosphate-dependent enzyme [Bacteroidia bacterium]|jgi:acetylornithine/N-succinyldiaminopimelate aminotransferase|nr:aminotransferase class III-fold pyridoxal phosphate-dependent enzyme [Bacteroidia bacterium]